MNKIWALFLIIGLSACLKAQITLGSTVDTFGVLAGSTVTNSGPTTVLGNLGVSPLSAVTGFPPGLVSGGIHSADALAGTAQTQLTTAYNLAAGAGPSTTIPAALDGLTYFPGVYNTGSSFGLTGILTLNALGNPNAQFIFQTPTTLTTASGSTVVLINGAQASNVYWQVGSSATLGTNSFFSGNILAFSSISLGTGAALSGRALARNGAVTLLSNVINTPAGLGGPPPPLPTPAPSSLILMSTALVGIFVYQGRKKILKPFRNG